MTRQLLAFVALSLALGGALYFVQDHNTDDVRAALILVCDAGNLQAAYEQIDGRGDKDVDYELVKELFPIVDCQQAAMSERGVELPLVPQSEQRQFVRMVGRGKIPLVEDGKITDASPVLSIKGNK